MVRLHISKPIIWVKSSPKCHKQEQNQRQHKKVDTDIKHQTMYCTCKPIYEAKNKPLQTLKSTKLNLPPQNNPIRPSPC